MVLDIAFEGELIPFHMEASEAEVIRAIEKAKEMFCFDQNCYTVTDDRVFLLAHDKVEDSVRMQKKHKRLYVFGDKIILQTDGQFPEEIEPTRLLLAHEKDTDPALIYVVEI